MPRGFMLGVVLLAWLLCALAGCAVSIEPLERPWVVFVVVTATPGAPATPTAAPVATERPTESPTPAATLTATPTATATPVATEPPTESPTPTATATATATATPTATACQGATVLANLRLRSGPGTDYATIITMPAGWLVQVDQERASAGGCTWAPVRWTPSGDAGWAAASCGAVVYLSIEADLIPCIAPAIPPVSPTPVITPTPEDWRAAYCSACAWYQTVIVNLRYRAAPGTGGLVLGTLPSGYVVGVTEVVEADGCDWGLLAWTAGGAGGWSALRCGAFVYMEAYP